MAAARVRQLFHDDDSDGEPPPQPTTASKQARVQSRVFDSSGDESATGKAAARRHPAIAANGRYNYMVGQRQEDSGDLRPTTPPTGPSPRNRQADLPAAALLQAQSDVMHGHTTGGMDAQDHSTQDIAADTSRRHTVSSLRAGAGQPTSSAKAAAARTFNSISSSEEDNSSDTALETTITATNEVSVLSLGHVAIASHRSTCSLVKSNPVASTAGDAAGPSAPSSRRSSVAGQAPTSGSSSFAAAAAAAFAGLQAQPGASYSRHQRASRTSRLRRVSSNASLSSKASQSESLASSRMKVSATVQRSVARQRLVDSSSGEEEAETGQGPEAVGAASMATAPAAGNAPNCSRKSLAAATGIIAAAQATAATAAAARRHPSAPAAARQRQEAAVDGNEHGAVAFSFNATHGSSRSSALSDALTPLMREATAAAAAEVAAEAASSLRQLPLTAIAPAHLNSTTRISAPNIFAEAVQANGDVDGITRTAFLSAGSAAAAAHAAAAAAHAATAAAMAELNSSQRIATWLEQQPRPPSMSSVGCADDLHSEYATTLTGTETEADGASAAAGHRGAAGMVFAAYERIISNSGEVELPGLGQHMVPHGTRLREMRLTISSTDEDAGSIGHAAAAAVGDTEQERGKIRPGEQAGYKSSGTFNSIAESAAVSAAPTLSPIARRLEFAGPIAAGAGLSDPAKDHHSQYYPLEAQQLGRFQAQSSANAHDGPVPTAPAGVSSQLTSKAGNQSAAEADRRLAVEPGSHPASGTAGRVASAGGLRSRSSPAGKGGRMTPGDLRAMLSVLARPAAHATASVASPSHGPSPQPSQVADSVSYSEMLQIMREMSPAGSLPFPQPMADAGSIVSSVSRASGSRMRVGKGADSAAAAPSPAVGLTSPPPQQRQKQPSGTAAMPHPSNNSSTVPAPSAGGSSLLLEEHPMASPPLRDWSNAGVTTSSIQSRDEQQQRDFAEMVRLWTMLTGQRLTPSVVEGSTTLSTEPSVAVGSTSSPSQGTAARAGVVHASDMPTSAAMWAASAAAMATSAVIAAATGGSQAAFQHRAQHQGALVAAAGPGQHAQSPLLVESSAAFAARSSPGQGPNSNNSSPPGQPRYPGFASLPQELQHLARLISEAGQQRHQQPQVQDEMSIPHSTASGVPAVSQDSRTRLVGRSAAGNSNESQLPPPQQQTQAPSTVSSAAQTDLVRLVRLLSAAGQTDTPPSTATAAAQTDIVWLVQLLSSAGQKEESETAVAATSTGGLAPRTATAATSMAGVSPAPMEAAPQQLVTSHGLVFPPTSAAVSTPAADGVDTAATGLLSTRSSADTVDTGLALSQMYAALRSMRLRDEGGQTDPPGMCSSNTQTAPDLRALHMCDDGGQTDPPVRASDGVQTEGLGAEVASGAVQIDADDLRAFAMRSEAGQTELPSRASASVQTLLHELVPTSEDGVQTDVSHLRGGPCRGVQTDAVDVVPAGAQTEVSWLAYSQPSAATQTLDVGDGEAAAFSAEVREELARMALAGGPMEQASLQLSAEAQTEVLRLARVLAAAGVQAEAERQTLSAEAQAQLVRTLRAVAIPAAVASYSGLGSALHSGEADFATSSHELSLSASEARATTDGAVQTDLTAMDLALARPRPSVDASFSNASADANSSITAAPAILSIDSVAQAATRIPSPPTSTQVGTAFALRNLPIASEGGLMDAPNQEAVVAGRLGSSGGMLAYLEAADPTTATALMELVQALQLMTIHKRRRRWISDGSSGASGVYYHHYAETPSPPPSIGRSSGAVTTLRGSFVTSIGPSVSQAGQASLAGAVAAAEAAATEEAMAAAGTVESAVPPVVKAATVGGEGAGSSAEAPQSSQRQTYTAGLPPRPSASFSFASDPTARHLQRALRAVSNGGAQRQASGAGGMGRGPAVVTTAPVASAAEAHIAHALELLSSSNAAVAPAAGSGVAVEVDEEAELLAQEELVAALMALLTTPPACSVVNVTNNYSAIPERVYPRTATEDAMLAPAELSLRVEAAEALTSLEQPQAAMAPCHEDAHEVDPAAAAELQQISFSVADGEDDLVVPAAEPEAPAPAEVERSEPPSPSAMLRAEIMVAMQQAERASASVSSLHTGYLPATPRAAEVLDGLPFEQAVGFILDGLRNFEGPTKLARNLHLLSESSRSTSTSMGGAAWEMSPSAGSGAQSSRRQTAEGTLAVVTEDGGAAERQVLEEADGTEQQQFSGEEDQERAMADVIACSGGFEALQADEGAVIEHTEAAKGAVTGGEGQQHSPVAPMARHLPSPSLALALSSNRSISPARPARSAGLAGAANGRQIQTAPTSSAGSLFDGVHWHNSAPGNLSGLATANAARQRSSEPLASPAASSPLRLIEQLAHLGAGEMAQLLPGGVDAAEPGSVLRSAPVTTAGSALALLALTMESPSPPTASPRTFGGAMDLPADSVRSPNAQQPHAMPYLPCGGLDEQLMPVHSELAFALAGDEVAELSPSPWAEDECDEQDTLDTPSQPLSTAAALAPRLPTFAMPSAPAVSCTPQPSARSMPAFVESCLELAAASSPLAESSVGSPSSLAVSEEAQLQGHPAEQHQFDVAKDECQPAECVASPLSDMKEEGGGDAAAFLSEEPSHGDIEQPHLEQSKQPPQPQEEEQALATGSAATGGEQLPASSHQLHTAGEPMCIATSHTDPRVPVVTAMDRFRRAAPCHSSPSPARGSNSAATAAGYSSAWAAAADSNADDPLPVVRLARDVMAGRHAAEPAAPEPPEAEVPAAGGGARRALFQTSRSGAQQQEEEDGSVAAASAVAPPVAASAVAANPAEQLFTQAAQLLLHAMQQAAEGQPEQQAAFAVLSPVLEGLAAAEPEQASDSSLALQQSSPEVILVRDTVSAAEAHSVDTGVVAPFTTLGEADAPSTAAAAEQKHELAGRSVQAPPQLQLGPQELQPMDSASFAFLLGDSAQAQTPTVAAPAAAAPPATTLATAADLEAFKDDIMSSVRSALMEIVDLIGHSVVQRASASATMGPAKAPSEQHGIAADAVAASHSLGGHGYESGSEATGKAGQGHVADVSGKGDTRPTTIEGMSATTEPSASSFSSGSDNQEIRITRAELEAFMFGKALLNSTATEDLLGVRLRDLYSRQLPQDLEDEELAGGYDASSLSSEDSEVPRDVASSSTSTNATLARACAGDQDQRHRHPSGSSVPSSPLIGRGGYRSMSSLGAGGRFGAPVRREADSAALRMSEPGSVGVGVPRNSPLRQPLGDGVDFKSLFRRSMEHLRDHLQQQHSDGVAAFPHRTDSPSPIRSPGPTTAPAGRATTSASAGPSPIAATRRPPMPPKRLPIPQHFSEDAADDTTGSDTESSGSLEATLGPAMSSTLAEQMAAAAANAIAEAEAAVEAAARADDDVELEMPHLLVTCRPEPTTGVPRCPDPAAPASQPAAQHRPTSALPANGSETVDEAIAAAEVFGDFLAALAEPVVQVAGLFIPPDPRVGSRPFPQRSVVIEELLESEDDDEYEAIHPVQHPQPQHQQQRERPSRVPGFAAGGVGWVEEDEADADSPRARSEASSPRLRHPALEQPRLQLSRSTSATPMLHAALAAATPGILAARQKQQQARSPGPVQLLVSQTPPPSRLKTASAPGGRVMSQSPADEDRPLSSFASPSTTSDGGAPTPSPHRRRTVSPGPLSRMAPQRTGSPGAAGSAPVAAPTVAAAALATATDAAPAAAAAVASPVSRLEELESVLRAFKSRIGEEAEASLSHARHQPSTVAATVASPSLAEDDIYDDVSSTDSADNARERDRTLAALATFGEEDDGVITGFNLHTIRASAASALAAAAAVEQVFSPRVADLLATEPIPEEEASAAGTSAGGSAADGLEQQLVSEVDGAGSMGGATDSLLSMGEASICGSAAVLAANPLLREHLEHFQALLEKANDLVDRLMVTDDDITSESGGTDITGSGATPRQRVLSTSTSTATPASTSASAVRRQLHNRLSQHQYLQQQALAIGAVAAAASPWRSLPAASPARSASVGPITPLPSLDPELAALFPATAARLTRPHAHVEQSQDAALSLVSSAVTAVPQLAVGAGRARSLSSTPRTRSPSGSFISVTTVATSATITAPTAAPAPPTATPLALVAALLAEAHSRMEFRSLEEQRGADKILSAVLDEHFAHVLGTPRGFLTPAREPMWFTAAAAAATAATAASAAAGGEGVAAAASQPQPLVQHPPEVEPFAGPANLSEAFNQAAATKEAPLEAAAGAGAASEAAADASRPTIADIKGGPAALQAPPQQPTAPSAAVVVEPQLADDNLVMEIAAAVASSAQTPQQQSAAAARDQFADLLGLMMQQRSDLLTSVLEQVHRAATPGPAPQTQTPLEWTAAATQQPPVSSPPPAHAPTSTSDGAAPAAAASNGSLEPTALPEPFTQPVPQLEEQLRKLDDSSGASSDGCDAAAVAAVAAAGVSPAQAKELSIVMAALSIPATSVGQQAPLPQPLMPYQEADSESTRTSYNASLAASFQAAMPHDFELPIWSRTPSAPGAGLVPCEVFAPGAAQLFVVSRGGTSGAPTSFGGDSTASAPGGPGPADAVDLSMLLANEDSSVSAGVATLPKAPAEAASAAVSAVGSGGGGFPSPTATASPPRRRASAMASDLHRSALRRSLDSVAESELSYANGEFMYEHRNAELPSGVPSAVESPDVSSGGAVRDKTFRYNPVYDPSRTSHNEPPGVYAGETPCSSSSGDSAQSGGMTTLHHETAYTPLALAAVEAGSGSVGASGSVQSTDLHSRLLSAGGTTTAVLVPNPAFDLMDDGYDDTPPSTSDLSLIAASSLARGPVDSTGSDKPAKHPVMRLDFSMAAAAGSGDHASASPSVAAGPSSQASGDVNISRPAPPVLPLSPVSFTASPASPSAVGRGDALLRSDGGVSMRPLSSPDVPASLVCSTDDLLSLLGPELTESQLSLLAAAPELPYSRPHSRSHSQRMTAVGLPPPYPHQHPLQHVDSVLGRLREHSSSGIVVGAESSEYRMGPEDSTAGSIDFDEISREAAAFLDTLATAKPVSAVSIAAAGSDAVGTQLLSLATAVEEEAVEPAAHEGSAARQAGTGSPARTSRSGLVAAAVRRIESGIPPPAASAEPSHAVSHDVATAVGLLSPKPAMKPAGRTPPGMPPRPVPSPGASHPPPSPVHGVSRRNSATSVTEEYMKGVAAAGSVVAVAADVAPAVAVAAEAPAAAFSGSEAPFAPASSRSLGASLSGGSVGDVLAYERASTLLTREWLPISEEASMADPVAAEHMYGNLLLPAYGSNDHLLASGGGGAVLLAADTAPTGLLSEPHQWQQRPASAGAGGRYSSMPGDAVTAQVADGGGAVGPAAQLARAGAADRSQSPARSRTLGNPMTGRSKSSSADGGGKLRQ